MKNLWLAGFALLVFMSAPAFAETTDAADSAVVTVTPDKPELIRLDEDAVSVIVTNPMHAAVVLDNARTLIILPRQPGSTSFTVLNAAGKVILEKNIVVATKENYMRVRRVCGMRSETAGAGTGTPCVPSTYYYCPNGCHEVMPVASDGDNPRVPEVVGRPSQPVNDAPQDPEEE